MTDSTINNRRMVCYFCNEEKAITKIMDNRNICSDCYNKHCIPKKVGNGQKSYCSICGEFRIIHSSKICETCYYKFKRPKRICANCGKYGVIAKKQNGLDYCKTCYRKYFEPRRCCIVCGKTSRTELFVESGSICPTCYHKYYSSIKICSVCNKQTINTRIIDGKEMCICCYIDTDNYHLLKLGNIQEEYREILSNNNISNLFRKFVELTLKFKKPFYAYLSAKAQLNIISQLNYYNIPLLEYYQQDTTNLGLPFKNFLMQEGIIIPLSQFEKFKSIQKTYLSRIPSKYIENYMQYSNYLISRKQLFLERGWENKFSHKTFKQYLITFCLLISFLDKENTTLVEMDDDFIYLFLDAHKYLCNDLRNIIRWTNRNFKRFKKLHLPSSRNYVNEDNYSEEEFLEILNNVNNDLVTFREKVICFLLLIYSIRPYELRNIKISDFSNVDSKMILYIREARISIDHYTANLINKYINNERSMKLSLGCNHDWLFPGKKNNLAISLNRISRIIKKYNIDANKAYRTSLVNIYQNDLVSPSILIIGLGIARNTAIKYYKYLNVENIIELNQNYSDTEIPTSISNFYVYILKCKDGSYYTGYTSNLNKRYKQHQLGIGCSYTKTRTPVELVYTEKLSDKYSALRREKQIKKLTLFEKEQLINKSRVN